MAFVGSGDSNVSGMIGKSRLPWLVMPTWRHHRRQRAGRCLPAPEMRHAASYRQLPAAARATQNRPVGLRSPGELVGYLSVLALHPDGFSIPQPEDADMVGISRVGA